MNKPLQPLKFQPIDDGYLRKVAKVIDNMLMAQEYRDKLHAAQHPMYICDSCGKWSPNPVAWQKDAVGRMTCEACARADRDIARIYDDPDYGPQNFFTP